MSKKPMASKVNIKRAPAKAFTERSYDQFLKEVARHDRRIKFWKIAATISVGLCTLAGVLALFGIPNL